MGGGGGGGLLRHPSCAGARPGGRPLDGPNEYDMEDDFIAPSDGEEEEEDAQGGGDDDDEDSLGASEAEESDGADSDVGRRRLQAAKATRPGARVLDSDSEEGEGEGGGAVAAAEGRSGDE